MARLPAWRDGDGGAGGGGDAQDNYMQLVADNEMNHLASVEISMAIESSSSVLF